MSMQALLLQNIINFRGAIFIRVDYFTEGLKLFKFII